MFELVILMHLRGNGHPRGSRFVERRSDVAEFLRTILVKNNTPAGVSKFLARMVEQKLIEKTSLTTREMREWYKQDGGYKYGLLLTRRGMERLAQFEAEINTRLILKFPTPLVQDSLTPAIQIATMFLTKEYKNQ
jgi:hypothetical protein